MKVVQIWNIANARMLGHFCNKYILLLVSACKMMVPLSHYSILWYILSRTLNTSINGYAGCSILAEIMGSNLNMYAGSVNCS